MNLSSVSMPIRVPFHNTVRALISSGYDMTEINSVLKKKPFGR